MWLMAAMTDGRYDLVINGGGSVSKTLTDVEIADQISPTEDMVIDDLTADVVTANSFVGPLTGNVTGNTAGTHTGAVTGNVTGNLTGNVTGNVTSTGTNTLAVIRQKHPIADVKAFGAVGDGTTDDAAAINAAIVYAEANGSVVYLPRGSYKVDSPIDMTERTALTFMGDGDFQDSLTPTSILGNTGSVVLDLMGSSNCHIRNIRIRVESTYANPADIGILQGRSGSNVVYQYSQYNTFDHVYVYMDSIPAATARGTVALYNVAAEHGFYTNCFFLADQPMAMTATDVLAYDSPIVGPTNSHSGPTSMTICKFIQCGFRAWTNAGCEFWAAENIDFDMCYWSRQPGSTSDYAFVVNQGSSQIRFNGQIEQWPAVMTIGHNLSDITLDVYAVSPTIPLVSFANTYTLSDSIIRIHQSGTAQRVLNSPAAGSVVRGCTIYTATTSGISDTDITITGGVIIADDATSNTITVNSASRFVMIQNDGTPRWDITSATTVGAAGAAAAMPTPVGYITVNINGTNRKIAYFNT
jgi:hypothetical protein